MRELTYDSIRPLVIGEQQQDDLMKVTFRCPRSGRVLSADAVIEARETVGSVATDVAKRETAWGLFSWVSNAVSSVLGGGVAGEVAGHVAGETAYRGVEDSRSFSFSAKDKETAVLEAFRSVQESFVYDEQNGQWVMR